METLTLGDLVATKAKPALRGKVIEVDEGGISGYVALDFVEHPGEDARTRRQRENASRRVHFHATELDKVEDK